MSACLICNNSVIQNDDPSNSNTETSTYLLESQVKVIFLLQKLLNVSTFRCENYLEKYGNPSTWISTCFECNSLLRDAYSYHCQIVKLQRKFSSLKGQVREKIKSITVKGHLRRRSRVTSLHAEIQNYCLEQELEGGGEDEEDDFDVKPDPAEDFACPLLKAEAILDPDEGQGQDDNDPIKNEPFEITDDSDVQIEDGDDIDIDEEFCGDQNDDDTDYDEDSSDDDSSTSGETVVSKKRKRESPSVGPDGNFICNHCTKTFAKRNSLRKHENYVHNVFYNKHKEGKVKPKIKKPCFEDFIEPAANGEFKCKICDKVCSKRDTLRKHQNVVHDLWFKKRLYESDGRIREIVVKPVNPGRGPRPSQGGEFKCSSCVKTFSTQIKLTRHTKFVHEKRSGENLEETINLANEEDDKTIDGVPTCDKCNVTFSTKAGLTNHNYVVHFKDSQAKMRPKKRVDYLLLVKDVTLKPWKCSQCFTWFATEEEEDEHSRIVHNIDLSKVDLETNFKCDLCPKTYSTKANLLLHAELVHAGEPFNMGTMTVYQCEHCPRKFMDESRFEFHLGKVHAVLKNPKKKRVGGICEFCGLACHTHLYFCRHMHLHSGERTILCELCSATFSEPRYLAFHKLRHHADVLPPQEKNALQCETCFKIFSTKDYLQVHVRTVHEKQYKFICDLCGAGREHESSFKQHMLSHGTSKMYACPHAGCNQSYKTSSGLSIHLSSHHSGKVFNCQFCERGFNNRHDCSRHEEAVHKKTTQFTCHVCSKEFPIRDYYRNHIKRCHKKAGVENS